MADKLQVLVIKESFAASAGKDLVSALTMLSCIGIGVWVGSAALQWTGGIIWLVWCAGKMVGTSRRNTFTIAGARKRLDDIEAGSQDVI